MPDFTDDPARRIYYEALDYAEKAGPKITDDDWESVLYNGPGAEGIDKQLKAMGLEGQAEAYRQHLKRDAVTKAKMQIRRLGTNNLERFYRAEEQQPGLWDWETGKYIGGGVYHVCIEGESYDIPMQHVDILYSAGETKIVADGRVLHFSKVSVNAAKVQKLEGLKSGHTIGVHGMAVYRQISS